MELNSRKYSSQDLQSQASATAKQVPGLWEPYEDKSFSREIESDKSKWTEDYYHLQEVYFKTNFSKKRWDHLVAVRQSLRDANTPNF